MARIAGVAVTSVSTAEIELLDGLTAGTVTASKAVVVDSSKQVDTLKATVGFQNVAIARTATVDGLTTAIIPDGGGHVTVTSSVNTKLITLPAPTPGVVCRIYVGANGYALQSSAPATVAINGGTGASAKTTLAASTLVEARCTSATTWVCNTYSADGTEAKTTAAA
jgi:hypothetical protein